MLKSLLNILTQVPLSCLNSLCLPYLVIVGLAELLLIETTGFNRLTKLEGALSQSFTWSISTSLSLLKLLKCLLPEVEEESQDICSWTLILWALLWEKFQ